MDILHGCLFFCDKIASTMVNPLRKDEKETPVVSEQILPSESEATEQPAVSSAETLQTPESELPTGPEVGAEQEPAEISSEVPVTPEPVVPTVAPAPIIQKDRLEKEIEVILEEDLTDLYLKMPLDKQVEFKAKGEETLTKVRQLVSSSKINAKKIFKLIGEWLKIIPGVNKFFLAQEAKIKTDKILLVTEEEKKRIQNDV